MVIIGSGNESAKSLGVNVERTRVSDGRVTAIGETTTVNITLNEAQKWAIRLAKTLPDIRG